MDEPGHEAEASTLPRVLDEEHEEEHGVEAERRVARRKREARLVDARQVARPALEVHPRYDKRPIEFEAKISVRIDARLTDGQEVGPEPPDEHLDKVGDDGDRGETEKECATVDVQVAELLGHVEDAPVEAPDLVDEPGGGRRRDVHRPHELGCGDEREREDDGYEDEVAVGHRRLLERHRHAEVVAVERRLDRPRKDLERLEEDEKNEA